MKKNTHLELGSPVFPPSNFCAVPAKTCAMENVGVTFTWDELQEHAVIFIQL